MSPSNTKVFERSFDEGTLMIVYQKPEARNLEVDQWHVAMNVLQVGLIEQKGSTDATSMNEEAFEIRRSKVRFLFVSWFCFLFN